MRMRIGGCVPCCDCIITVKMQVMCILVFIKIKKQASKNDHGNFVFVDEA